MLGATNRLKGVGDVGSGDVGGVGGCAIYVNAGRPMPSYCVQDAGLVGLGRPLTARFVFRRNQNTLRTARCGAARPPVPTLSPPNFRIDVRVKGLGLGFVLGLGLVSG